MTANWFDAVNEDALFSTAQALEDNSNRYRANADPNASGLAAQIYRDSPWLKPGEVLAMSKGNASAQAQGLASSAAARRAIAETDITRPQKKNWFERNVYDKLKTGTRWTFAALNLTPDLAQNVASQVFNRNNPRGFDGWFQSTQLGTMFANSGEAGEGFFLGGGAAEKQAERARKFRGTINGHAWTVGRGAADVLFTPGSREYNFLSGVVDAAVTVFADPTVIGGKATAGLRAGRAAIPALRTTEELSAAAKIAERGLAGLTEAESIAWNGSKFAKWLDRDARAQRLVNRLVGETDAHTIMKDLFDYKVDPRVAKRLAEAKTADEVKGIIGEAARRLDDAAVGIFPTDVRDIAGAKRFYARDRKPIQALRNSRLLTEVPGIDIRFGSADDAIRSIRNVSNYFDTVGIKSTSEKGKQLIKDLIDAYASDQPARLQDLTEKVDAIIREAGVAQLSPRLGDEVAGKFMDNVFALVRKTKDDLRNYFVDEAGNPYDANYLQDAIDNGKIPAEVLAEYPPEFVSQLRLAGPGLLLEMMDKVHLLPDPRVMRRITGNPFFARALSTKGGETRAVLAAAEYVQNRIWKPLALATGGYIFRNMFDAQIRLATVGAPGFFNHPFRYIQYVLHRKAPADIFNNKFVSKIDQEVAEFGDNLTQFQEAMTFGISRYIDDPVETARRGIRTGNFPIVSRMANRETWKKGLRLEWRQLAFDPIGRAYAAGLRGQELLDYLRKFPQGERNVNMLTDYLKRGHRSVDNTGNYTTLPGIMNPTDNDLIEWIDKLVGSRLSIKTGGNDEYATVIAHRRVPNGPEFLERPDAVLPESIIDGPTTPGVGTLYDVGGGQQGVIVAVEEVDGARRFRVRPVSANDVFDSDAGRKELTSYINNIADDTNLPDKVKYVEETLGAGKEKNRWDRTVDWFFGGHGLSYGRLSQLYERSPLYRFRYYETIGNNSDLLARPEAERLVTLIQENAAAAGMKPADYVGGQANYDNIRAALANGEGAGTVEQLQEYAQAIALRETKETLYNAAGRNNLEDMMRILVPFGVAWREVLGTYAKFLIEDPTRVRRAQLVYNGLSNADPDNDGQGFFYKDPTTGENVFNFPLSGELSKLLTGVEAPLQAPVKRLSMGFQVFPAVGPMGQIAAKEIIPDTPKTDAIVEVLLPYGRQEFSLYPGWAKKLYSAWKDQPGKLESVYANTYMETVRALAASGDYNLESDQDKDRLFADAKIKARLLTTMRAAAQFFGPTSASPEFIVPTDQGDFMASALVSEFYKLQKENYDTAVSEFLRKFGDDALLYISSKSRGLVGGLEATEEFGDWERQNADLIRSAPELAGYFAPGGSDYSFATWERQIRTGVRKRLTDEEMLDAAQYKIGSSLYRAAREKAGAYPTDEQKAWLRAYRTRLNAQYPGFPAMSEFQPNELPNKIGNLKLLVRRDDLANNGVAKAVREYLSYRDRAVQALEEAGYSEQGLSSAKAAEALRDYLANIGRVLVAQYPDFARIWERELSFEVER